MKNSVFLIAAVAIAAALPVSAKQKIPDFVVAKAVKDAPAVTLEPEKAYVLLRTAGAMPVHFVKIPTPEEQATWEKLKAEALVDAREDYVRKLKRYEEDLALAKKSQLKPPTKPIEPTEQNFRYATFEQLANFTIGAFNRFNNKDGSIYLHAVTPGTYRIYGQTDPYLGGGVCYCMGSVTFEAKAGGITDLGTLAGDPSNTEEREKGDSSSPRLLALAMALTPAGKETTVDPRLTALPRTPAIFHAAGKTSNYMGIAISRLPAIPGILAYERDRIIDLATPAAVASVIAPAPGSASVQ